MSINTTILLIILGCALVTFIPRIMPFVIVKNVKLSPHVIKWLSFIPVCIFTALVVEGFINHEGNSLLSVDWTVVLAIIPTLLAALYTKSLGITVVVGVVCMAGIRFFMS